jgi:hypothetical protein
MKKSRLFIYLASFILGLLALGWSRAQTPSHRLKVLDDKGVEVHTLMSDQYNALVGHLEATGQTNAIELFRQYRCAYNADLSSRELRDTVAALQHLRAARTNEAIQLLEQHLNLHASFICNSYGCLNPTNRERVQLESLERAQDYYSRFPPSKWGAEMEKGVNVILKPRKDAETEMAVNEILRRSEKPTK